MRKLITTLFLMVAFIGTTEANEPFPTDETVRYVIGCMAEIGGQTEENLYTCVCRIEHISDAITYEVYDGGNIMERYRKMPGKKGGFFRDNKEGDKMYEKLQAAREEAAKQCPTVVRIEAKKSSE